MASTTLVRKLLERLSVQLNDSDPQFVRWTQRELLNSVNDARRAVAKYIPGSFARVDAFKLKPGTKQSIEHILAVDIKPGDGSAATNVEGTFLQSLIRNMGADGLTPGKAIRLIDRDNLDITDPDWHTKLRSPVTGLIFDPRTPKVFYVVPGVPVNVSCWVEGSILVGPVDIPDAADYGMNGTDTTTLGIDDKHVDDVFNYAMARAYMKDAEYAADGGNVQLHTSLFTGSINAQAVALHGVNPNLRSLPMSPSTPNRQAA